MGALAPGEEGEEEATAPEECSGGEGVTTAQAGAVEEGTGGPTGAEEEEEGATRTGGDLTEAEEEGSPDEIVDQLYFENTKTILTKRARHKTFFFYFIKKRK